MKSFGGQCKQNSKLENHGNILGVHEKENLALDVFIARNRLDLVSDVLHFTA